MAEQGEQYPEEPMKELGERFPVEDKKKKDDKNIIAPDTINLRGRGLSAQTQWVIHNVLNYFESEKHAKTNILPFAQAIKRTCKAAGVSKRTVIRIAQHAETGKPFETPGLKHPNRTFPKRGLNEDTKNALKDLIDELNSRGEGFTLASLLLKIRERGIDYKGGKTTLKKVCMDLGYLHDTKETKRWQKKRREPARSKVSPVESAVLSLNTENKT